MYFFNFIINFISNHEYFLYIQYIYNIKHTVKFVLRLVKYLLRNSTFNKKNKYSEIIYVKTDYIIY